MSKNWNALSLVCFSRGHFLELDRIASILLETCCTPMYGFIFKVLDSVLEYLTGTLRSLCNQWNTRLRGLVWPVLPTWDSHMRENWLPQSFISTSIRLSYFISLRVSIAIAKLQKQKHIHNDQHYYHDAPKLCKAIRSSLTAVSTSSKFNAEIAHLACF